MAMEIDVYETEDEARDVCGVKGWTRVFGASSRHGFVFKQCRASDDPALPGEFDTPWLAR
jgi:hypothetical protein